MAFFGIQGLGAWSLGSRVLGLLKVLHFNCCEHHVFVVKTGLQYVQSDVYSRDLGNPVRQGFCGIVWFRGLGAPVREVGFVGEAHRTAWGIQWGFKGKPQTSKPKTTKPMSPKPPNPKPLNFVQGP